MDQSDQTEAKAAARGEPLEQLTRARGEIQQLMNTVKALREAMENMSRDGERGIECAVAEGAARLSELRSTVFTLRAELEASRLEKDESQARQAAKEAAERAELEATVAAFHADARNARIEHEDGIAETVARAADERATLEAMVVDLRRALDEERRDKLASLEAVRRQAERDGDSSRTEILVLPRELAKGEAARDGAVRDALAQAEVAREELLSTVAALRGSLEARDEDAARAREAETANFEAERGHLRDTVSALRRELERLS